MNVEPLAAAASYLVCWLGKRGSVDCGEEVKLALCLSLQTSSEGASFAGHGWEFGCCLVIQVGHDVVTRLRICCEDHVVDRKISSVTHLQLMGPCVAEDLLEPPAHEVHVLGAGVGRPDLFIEFCLPNGMPLRVAKHAGDCRIVDRSNFSGHWEQSSKEGVRK